MLELRLRMEHLAWCTVHCQHQAIQLKSMFLRSGFTRHCIHAAGIQVWARVRFRTSVVHSILSYCNLTNPFDVSPRFNSVNWIYSIFIRRWQNTNLTWSFFSILNFEWIRFFMAGKENGAFLDTEIVQDTKIVRDTGRLNESNWDSKRNSVFIRTTGRFNESN